MQFSHCPACMPTGLYNATARFAAKFHLTTVSQQHRLMSFDKQRCAVSVALEQCCTADCCAMRLTSSLGTFLHLGALQTLPAALHLSSHNSLVLGGRVFCSLRWLFPTQLQGFR